MPETIGQHQIAAITAPVNGQPQDANVVRGNDNTLRVGHNDHDNDSGVHLQSSAYGSRPVAGVAGRKWVTTDGGRYELWYDDGSRWHHVSAGIVLIDAVADAGLTAGDVVKVTGFSVGQQLPRVDVTSAATDVAFGIVLRDVSSGGIASVVNTGIISPIDTNGYSEGTILYSAGSGNLTASQPASGSYQACAIVLRGNGNNGVVFVEFSEQRTVEATAATANTLVKRDGSGGIAAVAANVTTVNATTVNATNLNGAVDASDVQPGTFPNGTFTAQNITVTGTLTAATIAAVAASAVTPGTFANGSYTFPQSLTITQSLTVDTNVLRVDHANNRVGTNVTSPQEPYHGVGTHRIDGRIDLSNTASGTIKFPATPTASADATTLDSYKEGTWTPEPEYTIGTSFSSIEAKYIKVGRLVHISCSFQVSSSEAQQFRVIGLPFPADMTLPFVAFPIPVNSSDAGGLRVMQAMIDSNDTMQFYRVDGTGTTITYANLNADSVYINGSYITTD